LLSQISIIICVFGGIVAVQIALNLNAMESDGKVATQVQWWLAYRLCYSVLHDLVGLNPLAFVCIQRLYGPP
jgi:hypothetical protein